MKPENDGLYLEVRREPGAVEASIAPVDALYREAKQHHDPDKIKRYSEERASLLRARDKLQKELEEIAASDVSEDHHRNSISSAWQGIKHALEDFMKTHG